MESERPAHGAASESPVTQEPVAPPKVDAVVFARKRETLQGRQPLSTMTRLLTAGVQEGGMLEWSVEGFVATDETKRQREYLRVRTSFSPWMICSRCLEPVEVSGLSTDTRFRLAASEQQAAAEDREADEEEVIAASTHLDLAALVEDEAILALPMAPAHGGCEWKAEALSGSSGDV